jgi:hypothetical protein
VSFIDKKIGRRGAEIHVRVSSSALFIIPAAAALPAPTGKPLLRPAWTPAINTRAAGLNRGAGRAVW